MAQKQQDLKGKEEYQDIVLELMKYVGYIAIDNPQKFPHAIEVVRDYMEVYLDDQLTKAIDSKNIEKEIASIPGTNKEFKLAKVKLRELVKLFGRAGFIEARRIEGVLDGETLDRIARFSKPEAE